MSRALYQHIAASLRQRILSGGHPAGDILPSENELAGAYRTSRVTVRKAFQILESEGLIKARQGKGYIVQPPRHEIFTMVFGQEPDGEQYRCLEVSILSPDPAVSEKLDLMDGQPVIAIRRILERKGQPVAYDEKYIPYERGKPIVEAELRFSEFPDLFADRFVSVSLRTEMQIFVERPPERVSRILSGSEEPLMTVERLILTTDGRRIGYGIEYLLPEFGPLKATSGHTPKTG